MKMTRPSMIAWILCLAIGVPMGILWHNQTQNTPESAVAGVDLGGPFTLVDQDGKTVTDKSWPEKYLLLYFGFTHCPDICPLGLNKMAEALKELPATQSDKIQPILITVDPARDTPPALKEYVTLFDSRLVGLTGSHQQIEHVKKLFRVFAQKQGDGDDYMVNHSGFIYLMGPGGKTLNIYVHETTAKQLADSLKETVK
jgi:protein SCO1